MRIAMGADFSRYRWCYIGTMTARALAFLALSLLAGCGGGDDCLSGGSVFVSEAQRQAAECDTQAAQAPALQRPVVLYTVTGDAPGASLTYTNEQGGTEQRSVSLPWSTAFTGKAGNQLYLSAQNTGQAGSITVTISVDGKARKTSTSAGAFVIATASDGCC